MEHCGRTSLAFGEELRANPARRRATAPRKQAIETGLAISSEGVRAAARDPSDYRWTPPDRRHVYAGLYLPSVQREGIGKIVLVVDTSGSIGDEELAMFAGEITAIVDQTQPESLVVVYCDTAVRSFAGGCSRRRDSTRAQGRRRYRLSTRLRVGRAAGNPACVPHLPHRPLLRLLPSRAGVPPTLWVTDSRSTALFGETIQISTD